MNEDIDKEEKDILQAILDSNVYYDRIMDIKVVKPSKEYVYDLTVENDKTFIELFQIFDNKPIIS